MLSLVCGCEENLANVNCQVEMSKSSYNLIVIYIRLIFQANRESAPQRNKIPFDHAFYSSPITSRHIFTDRSIKVYSTSIRVLFLLAKTRGVTTNSSIITRIKDPTTKRTNKLSNN